MTTKSQLLMELITESANDREPGVTTWLALQLARACAKSQASGADESTPAALAPKQQDLVLSVVTPSLKHEIAQVIRRYISDRDPGDFLKFGDIADYVASTPGIVLNTEIVKTEKRERWRQHVSNVLVRLRSQGVIGMTGQNQKYVIIRRP